MGRISPGPTRWPPGAERRLVPAKSNLKPQTSNHQATPSFPRPASWGRGSTGPSSGAPCPYPRRESRVVQPNELLLKGSGIKAVFSLALLPRRPYMRESSCSVGGGVDSSNHQFPRQTFPIRLQVRLRVGRLTPGLTVADRWECSQTTGLPAWRHQDLHTSQRIGHTVSRALKQKNLYLGTGPGWTLCKSMLPATRGAFVVDSHPVGGKNSPNSVMG